MDCNALLQGIYTVACVIHFLPPHDLLLCSVQAALSISRSRLRAIRWWRVRSSITRWDWQDLLVLRKWVYQWHWEVNICDRGLHLSVIMGLLASASFRGEGALTSEGHADTSARAVLQFMSCHWVRLGSLFIDVGMDVSRVSRTWQEQSGGVSCSWKYARCQHSLKSPLSWFHSHLGLDCVWVPEACTGGGCQTCPERPVFPHLAVLTRTLMLSFHLSPALLVTCLFTSLLHWGYVVPVIKSSQRLNPGPYPQAYAWVFPWHIDHLNPLSWCPTQAWVLSSQPPCVSCSQIVTHQALGLLHQ